ncbi:MAG TPA: zf-HC2 domain-containing protein [Pyrinomonadaceae bacterium]|nr:zf-HC2 domain-containing protein [Pyrinomonadaceae bacterium]
MFSKHVTRDLSAYCHGELPAAQARKFAEHLLACSRCRAQFDEIKLGIKLAEQLPQFSAPESLWPELDHLWETRSGPSQPAQVKPLARVWRGPLVAIAALVLLAVGLGLFLFLKNSSRPSWEVARLDGAPRIGSATISGKGLLAVGQWLETDGSSRAQITVGSIGQVEIDPNTRVRLLQTRPTEHRLELAQGRMSARIWAPPRLFFVDTPSAVAADLGCAYTLEVNDQGESLLHVTSGWVSLELKDRESMVPAGAACQTRPGIGPGTPYFEDASTSFRMALTKFDFETGDATVPLQTILSEARPRDSLTLWHLLFRVQGADRVSVYDRLTNLSPPPPGVTREGVMQLNQEMLERWKSELEKTWTGSSSLGKAWKRIWTSGVGRINGLAGKK